MDWKVIGAKIKNARQKKSMSQVELAKKIGCTSAFICQLENGSKKASVDNLAKLSEALGINFFK